jgi:hypothetical protein
MKHKDHNHVFTASLVSPVARIGHYIEISTEITASLAVGVTTMNQTYQLGLFLYTVVSY